MQDIGRKKSNYFVRKGEAPTLTYMNRTNTRDTKDDVLNWEYRNAGFHFITLCTLDGMPYFGQIRNEIMGLSIQGCVARYCWMLIPYQFPGVFCDSLIVMPNHLHGILKVGRDVNGGPVPKLDALVRAYKKGVMRFCHREGVVVMWKSGYQNELIENHRSLQKIREYIAKDPIQWNAAWCNVW